MQQLRLPSPGNMTPGGDGLVGFSGPWHEPTPFHLMETGVASLPPHARHGIMSSMAEGQASSNISNNGNRVNRALSPRSIVRRIRHHQKINDEHETSVSRQISTAVVVHLGARQSRLHGRRHVKSRRPAQDTGPPGD